jgi:hypothetical protein
MRILASEILHIIVQMADPFPDALTAKSLAVAVVAADAHAGPAGSSADGGGAPAVIRADFSTDHDELAAMLDGPSSAASATLSGGASDGPSAGDFPGIGYCVVQ